MTFKLPIVIFRRKCMLHGPLHSNISKDFLYLFPKVIISFIL